MYCLPCTVPYVQCTVYRLLCYMYSVLCTVLHVQCSVYCVLHLYNFIQCILTTPYLTYSLHHSLYDLENSPAVLGLDRPLLNNFLWMFTRAGQEDIDELNSTWDNGRLPVYQQQSWPLIVLAIFFKNPQYPYDCIPWKCNYFLGVLDL